jgi:hypothetical protein
MGLIDKLLTKNLAERPSFSELVYIPIIRKAIIEFAKEFDTLLYNELRNSLNDIDYLFEANIPISIEFNEAVSHSI